MRRWAVVMLLKLQALSPLRQSLPDQVQLLDVDGCFWKVKRCGV